MSEALGLSIGVANLVAARAGGVPVSRRSVLTLFDQRPSEVGLPDQNPDLNEAGLVVRGFVERVGDRAPLVATDGTRYLGAALTVQALEAMARMVGYGTPIAIAVPAYWSDGQTAALRNEFRGQPNLAPNGAPPLLISDAKAAAAGLYTKPGFPTNGIVGLCDFGAGGASVTLIKPGSNFKQIGQSVRRTGFSGDNIDQLIANHFQVKARNARTASLKDAVRTGLPGLSPGDCRRVKEQLSAVDVTAIGADFGVDIRLSRNEFEKLISQPLDRFITSVEETLQRNGIPRGSLAAVAIVGGGASIPFLTTRLSERLSVPVFTTPQPAFTAAIGAAILARQQSPASAHRAPSPAATPPPSTASTPPPTMASAPPTMAGTPPPTMASAPPTMASPPPPSASTPPPRAATPPPRASTPPPRAGTPPAIAGTPPTVAGAPQTETSPTASSGERANAKGPGPYGALAWSEVTGTGGEPVPYTGPDHTDEPVEETTGDHEEGHEEGHEEDHEEDDGHPTEPGKLPWYKHTALILTVVGACAAVLLAAGLALKLVQSKTSPTTTTTPSQPETSQTTTVTTPNTTTEVPSPTTESSATTTETPTPSTPTYIPPPPTNTQPTRTNQPPTTTPSQKTTARSPQTSPPSATTTRHGPLLPTFPPPTPKH
jgi:actin-like ATPase involved in cell morphogenesis